MFSRISEKVADQKWSSFCENDGQRRLRMMQRKEERRKKRGRGEKRLGNLNFVLILATLDHTLNWSATNLVPRVSPLHAPGSERGETLVGAGHVSPRIWEITNK